MKFRIRFSGGHIRHCHHAPLYLPNACRDFNHPAYGDSITSILINTTIGELGYSDLLKVISIDYMVGAPPGTPETIMNIWRDVFNKAVADPEFQKIMREQLRHPLGPLNGKQAAQKVKDYFGVYSRYKDLVMQYTPK